jgi:TolB-like protein/DNA-binding winged helix-turn-helix (wHTH) protein/Tfp pilus assembly protein PilF
VLTVSRRRFGLFDFDARGGELRREGEVVKLAPQPARVLALLLTRPGEVVLREEFQREIWGSDTFVDFERGLNFCILQVRAALGDSSDNPRFVQTVPRKGYRFIAPVASGSARAELPATYGAASTERREADEETVAPLPPTYPPSHPTSAPPHPAAAPPHPRAPAWRWWAAAAVIAILTPAAWLAFGNRATTAPANAAPYRIRIAVLPFVNLTGDTSADYLADGLTDELITQLGTLSRQRVAVIARTSAMTYRDSSRTVARIGEELDVQYVVESSIRRDGSRLRVGSNLVSVVDETPFAGWSETFDNTAASPDAHQTAAAVRLARLIALSLLPDSATVPSAQRPIDPAAWDTFLQGVALINLGTPDAVRRALSQFEAATTRDPGFAAAWAKSAEARHLLVMMGALAPTDAYPGAREAAERALATDRDLPEAHLARGLVQLWFDWQPAAAAASFERALALNDSLAAAHHDYGWSLMALGRNDDAARHIIEARDLDPLSTRANTDIGWLYLHLRQPDEAARACEHTLTIQPSSLEAQACLERSYTQRGMFDAALEAARATLPPSADLPIPEGATPVEALRAIWQWRLRRMENAAQTRWVSPYTVAVQHLQLGDLAKGLEHLERAHRERVGMMVFLARDPALDAIRGDARFQALQRASETAR